MPYLYKRISVFLSGQLAELMVPVVGRSKLVHVAKITLLLMALGITAILVILPVSGGINKKFRLTFSSVGQGENADTAKMLNPYLQGVDGSGQTYNISAESATQDKKDMMVLSKINGDINLKGGGWVSLTADEGFFNHTNNTLDLLGNINIFNDGGYEFSTSEAYANIKNGTVYGNEEISGQGPSGNIRADGFYVEENGRRVRLMGHVKLVIYPGPGME